MTTAEAMEQTHRILTFAYKVRVIRCDSYHECEGQAYKDSFKTKGYNPKTKWYFPKVQ